MHEASRGPLKGAVSAQKAFQGSETKTTELLGGTEENSVSPDEGSLICPPGKSMIFFTKKETEKNRFSQTCLVVKQREEHPWETQLIVESDCDHPWWVWQVRSRRCPREAGTAKLMTCFATNSTFLCLHFGKTIDLH